MATAVLACACSPTGTACGGPTCGTGYECLANRCATAGGAPIPHGTERLVLPPIAMAIGAGRGVAPESTTVTLGGGACPDEVLYLRFGARYKDGAEVAAAFLLLTPAAGAETTDADVPLEVRTLATAWSTDSLARGARPRASVPTARGLARVRPPSVVRVDVTSIVRALARAPADSGMVVEAAASRGAGVTLVTAAAGAPRLELYLTRPSVARGAW